MVKSAIGIIGGSGLYSMEGVKIKEERSVKTPFGPPSDVLMIGTLENKDVVFLPRHGRGHIIPPHKINYRANIYALKELGVNTIISASAVGSMKEEIAPGHIVIVDQFVDRTKMRDQTFFEDGIVAHVPFADPVCSRLSDHLYDAAKEAGAVVHKGGSYVCIEGPMFSSRAESKIYRSWGMDVIGMTGYQEAKLAREAEFCYATLALCTDYDCWHESEEDVDVAMIIDTMKRNTAMAKSIIKIVLSRLDDRGKCVCNNVLEGAILTDPTKITDEAKRRLKAIIGKYV